MNNFDIHFALNCAMIATGHGLQLHMLTRTQIKDVTMDLV